jgi:hypothetical protein
MIMRKVLKLFGAGAKTGPELASMKRRLLTAHISGGDLIFG